MYRIIGGDGNQYGPVTAEQLRQWVTEGRVTAATQTLADGAAEWKPLGAQTEFAALFGSNAAPTSAPPVSALPVAAGEQIQEFPVVATVLLTFCTCGLFGHLYLNRLHGKFPKIRPDDPSAGKAQGFLFIPFFNLYWFFFTYTRLCKRLDEQRVRCGLAPANLNGLAIGTCICHVIPYVNLFIALPIMWPIFHGMLQSKVNELARASSTAQ